MFWIALACFVVFTAACSWSIRTHHYRIAGLFVPCIMTCYAETFVVRRMTSGTASLAFFCFDLAVVLLGIQSTLALLTAFDTPMPDDDDNGGGFYPLPDDDPDPASGTPAPDDPWREFDEQRASWERLLPTVHDD